MNWRFCFNIKYPQTHVKVTSLNSSGVEGLCYSKGWKVSVREGLGGFSSQGQSSGLAGAEWCLVSVPPRQPMGLVGKCHFTQVSLPLLGTEVASTIELLSINVCNIQACCIQLVTGKALLLEILSMRNFKCCNLDGCIHSVLWPNITFFFLLNIGLCMRTNFSLNHLPPTK